MNIERFQGSPSGRLVAAGPAEARYWAYVPNPLPPAIELDNQLWRIQSDADRALGELAGLGRLMPNPHLFINPFIRREAVLSSRIEGTQADIADLYAYEAGQLSLPGMPQPSEADVREVLNYVYALQRGLERLRELPVCLRLVRELHQRLMVGVRGEHASPGDFRQRQNWIGRPGCTLADAEFVPPPVEQMHEALAAFERYLHDNGDDYPPLVRLALIHYQFEAIHPFLDGNGRVGRLLIPLLLVHWGLLPAPLLYLSAYFERHRDAYYELLLAVSERAAWREWIAFFLRGVAEQARDATARAKRLQDLQQRWRERLTEGRASALLLRLLDSLFESPFVSIPQARRILGASYVTAQRCMQRLVDAGVVRQASEGSYGRVFVAAEVLAVIGEPAGQG